MYKLLLKQESVHIHMCAVCMYHICASYVICMFLSVNQKPHLGLNSPSLSYYMVLRSWHKSQRWWALLLKISRSWVSRGSANQQYPSDTLPLEMSLLLRDSWQKPVFCLCWRDLVSPCVTEPSVLCSLVLQASSRVPWLYDPRGMTFSHQQLFCIWMVPTMNLALELVVRAMVSYHSQAVVTLFLGTCDFTPDRELMLKQSPA